MSQHWQIILYAVFLHQQQSARVIGTFSSMLFFKKYFFKNCTTFSFKKHNDFWGQFKQARTKNGSIFLHFSSSIWFSWQRPDKQKNRALYHAWGLKHFVLKEHSFFKTGYTYVSAHCIRIFYTWWINDQYSYKKVKAPGGLTSGVNILELLQGL